MTILIIIIIIRVVEIIITQMVFVIQLLRMSVQLFVTTQEILRHYFHQRNYKNITVAMSNTKKVRILEYFISFSLFLPLTVVEGGAQKDTKYMLYLTDIIIS